MFLLIDGNNLLHVSDLFATDANPGISSPQLLVDMLHSVLGRRAIGEIVFDGRPQGRAIVQSPSETLRIHHPSRTEDADDVLERLIEHHAEPKRLVVISSDHRIQRAARRHGAQWRDSEDFWDELRRLRAAANRPAAAREKPGELSADEVQAWLREFGGTEGLK